MQLVATAEQMRAYDRTAIRSYAIPGLILMENAGRGFVDELRRRRGSLRGQRAVILCGKGNNGGDGFVIARHLLNAGCTVEVALLARRGEVTGDAATMLSPVLQLARQRRSGMRFREITTARSLRSLRPGDLAIDAILGTGFTGALSGLPKHAAEWINAHRHFVASVDVPTGVNASTGRGEGLAVRADLTVTMGLAKIGHYVGDGREASGHVAVTDIAIPSFALTPDRNAVYRIEPADVSAALPRRQRTAHKYSVGKVLVLAGSRTYPGAAALCATAALRSGAGAVVLATPSSAKPLLHRRLLEVIVEPLPETAEGTLAGTSREALRDRLRWADVLIIGPGLARHPETDDLVRGLIQSSPTPVMLDADGLNAVSEAPALLRRARSPIIITPHAGELSRLVGSRPAELETDRVEAARDAARRFRCVVVLKGNPTATAAPARTVWLNTTGNPGLATIGSGDVLSGIIGGLWAQGMNAPEAAWSGVYLHGLAADLVAAEHGERSLLAGDLIARLGNAFEAVGDTTRSAG